jgi:hypothetical protein
MPKRRQFACVVGELADAEGHEDDPRGAPHCGGDEGSCPADAHFASHDSRIAGAGGRPRTRAQSRLWMSNPAGPASSRGWWVLTESLTTPDCLSRASVVTTRAHRDEPLFGPHQPTDSPRQRLWQGFRTDSGAGADSHHQFSWAATSDRVSPDPA